MKIASILLVLCCCMGCANNTSDEQLIVAKRMAFNDAIADHDISSMSKYCSEDIYVVTSRNSKSTSREQYAAFLEQDFKMKEGVIYVRTPATIEIFPPWQMAAESGHWVGTWKADTTSINISGSYYAKWQKVNGEWLIMAEIFTPLKCSGGPYCSEVPK